MPYNDRLMVIWAMDEEHEVLKWESQMEDEYCSDDDFKGWLPLPSVKLPEKENGDDKERTIAI